jgi:hypothetical protein
MPTALAVLRKQTDRVAVIDRRVEDRHVAGRPITTSHCVTVVMINGVNTISVREIAKMIRMAPRICRAVRSTP